jgi:hypothetical protein
MIPYLLNHLDEITKEKIKKNNDQYARGEIREQDHEHNYEAIMQHWRMETERILSLRLNPYDLDRKTTPD